MRIRSLSMSDRAIHFAIFKWKEDAPINEIEACLAEQKDLIVSAVPGIRSFEWGVNKSPFGQGYTHALTVIADDLGTIQKYRESALRQRTKPLFRQWMVHDVSADFGKE